MGRTIKKNRIINVVISGIVITAVGCAKEKANLSYEKAYNNAEYVGQKKPQEAEVEILLKNEQKAPSAVKAHSQVVSQPIVDKIVDRQVNHKQAPLNGQRHHAGFPGGNFGGVDAGFAGGFGGAAGCVEDPLTVVLECGAALDNLGYAAPVYPAFPFFEPVFRVGYPIWDAPLLFEDDGYGYYDDDNRRNDDDSTDDDNSNDDDLNTKKKPTKKVK